MSRDACTFFDQSEWTLIRSKYPDLSVFQTYGSGTGQTH
jgi:hypothetical protein